MAAWFTKRVANPMPHNYNQYNNLTFTADPSPPILSRVWKRGGKDAIELILFIVKVYY